jgi:hypothetical protein
MGKLTSGAHDSSGRYLGAVQLSALEGAIVVALGEVAVCCYLSFPELIIIHVL